MTTQKMSEKQNQRMRTKSTKELTEEVKALDDRNKNSGTKSKST